ncbi:hypothetical protein E4T42_05634 [Aureobasidium subglaciale]|nr:hypothetical protein E4T42_05634 [Aureobasidium subglaciale]
MPHSISPTQSPATPTQPILFVNDGPLEDYSWLQPSHPDEPLEELRRKYNEDGYIFLKGLIPREDVLKARRSYFDTMAPTGVLKPGTTPQQGIFDSSKPASQFPGIGAGAVGGNKRPGDDSAATFVDRALDAHKQDWYKEEFCKHPALLEFVAKFSGWGDDTLAIKRTLLRNNIPGTHAIGVHYDQIFLRHGEATAITAWVPIGDVKTNGGGLIYLEKGHTLGREQESRFYAEALSSGLSDKEAKHAFNANMMSTGLLDSAPSAYGKRFSRRWLVADYEAGDVVLHTPFTIHASTVNHDVEGVIRLATDLRFVNSSRKWDERWDKVYEMDDGL